MQPWWLVEINPPPLQVRCQLQIGKLGRLPSQLRGDAKQHHSPEGNLDPSSPKLAPFMSQPSLASHE